jgi:hypothetical protein
MALLSRGPRRIGAAALALWTLHLPAGLWAQGDAAVEYQVKAAFLYNFTKFVEWPADPQPQGPFRLCVVGSDPFGGSLEAIVRGETVAGRPLVVDRVDNDGQPLEKVRSCHVLFISRSERERLRQILDTVAGGAVLTVSDIPGFLDAGGQIELVLVGTKVRFAIEPAAAARSGLKISSKLLRLALPKETRD